MALNKLEDEIEESGLVSAIWILSCNDSIYIMTYEYIELRLGLNKKQTQRLLENHKELFLTEIPKELDEWKKQMRQGNLLPGRFKANKNKKIGEEIEKIHIDDVFRSQFRDTFNAPISPIEITKWGLEHLEKKRRAKVEAKEEKWKKLKEVWLPFATLVLAIITVLLTSYWQYENIQSQKQLKEYEVSFKPRQEGYAEFMKSLIVAFQTAAKGAREIDNVKKSITADELSNHIDNAEKAYFALEPFIEFNKRKEIYDKLKEYRVFLLQFNLENALTLSKEQLSEKVKVQVEYELFFKEKLFNNLFSA